MVNKNDQKTYNFLFQSEDIVVEKLVQLFVGVVDAELLEGVDRKVLEAEYIENAQEPRRVLSWVCASVDVVHQPRESSGVECLRHRVPVLSSLRHSKDITPFSNS